MEIDTNQFIYKIDNLSLPAEKIKVNSHECFNIFGLLNCLQASFACFGGIHHAK